MKIKKILLDFVMNCYRALFTSTNFSLSYKNRLDFDAEILRKLRKQQSLKSQVPLISAVIRVKNGEEYIEASILSILPLVSEVVIIDNGSKDNTLLIVKRLKKELQNKININIFSYDKKIEIAGEGYSQRVSNNPDGSLADFYNYSFSLARCEYLMKWDAHAIMFEHAVDKIQSLLKNSPDAILFRGLEFYGKNLNQEIRIYRNDIGIEYSDSEFYEKITFTNKNFNELKTKKLITPAYLHLKRLSYNKMIDENHENIISKKYE